MKQIQEESTIFVNGNDDNCFSLVSYAKDYCSERKFSKEESDKVMGDLLGSKGLGDMILIFKNVFYTTVIIQY